MIYKRGFSLKQCGIGLGNRSFVLKKNDRNTREILQAAYGLIEAYEFADVDEENIQKPTAPDLSSRHGEKPLVVKCLSYNDECDFVIGRIKEIIEEQRLRDETAEMETGHGDPNLRDRLYEGRPGTNKKSARKRSRFERLSFGRTLLGRVMQ